MLSSSKGRVIVDGKETERDLMLDVYAPSEPQDNAARPAVILVHGGAFRIAAEGDSLLFVRLGRFIPGWKIMHGFYAPLGYVCFVIEYRLALELPQTEMQPGTGHLLPLDAVVDSSPHWRAPTSLGKKWDLRPSRKTIAVSLLWRCGYGRCRRRLAKAVSYIQANADKFGVDPSKIAVGGHSAGGGNAMNVAIGLNLPIAAAFPLSPPASMFDLAEVMKDHEPPPILMSRYSQNDVALTLENGIPNYHCNDAGRRR